MRLAAAPLQPLLLLLLVDLSLGQDTTTTTTPECHTSIDTISMEELDLSIRRRNESLSPWANVVANAENEAAAEAQEAALIPSKRRYILCPNTTFTIGSPLNDDPEREDAFYIYEGGSIPLLVINPNMEVWCGQDGHSSNNCIFEGGEYQVVSSKVLMPPALRDMTYHVNPANFYLKGVTLRGSTFRALQFGEVGQDRGILFQDCIFERQTEGRFVAFIQTLGLSVGANNEEVTPEDEQAAGQDTSGRQLRQRHLRRGLQAEDGPENADPPPTELPEASTEQEPEDDTTVEVDPNEEEDAADWQGRPGVVAAEQQSAQEQQQPAAQDGPEDLIGEADETTAEMPEPAETTEPASPEDLIGVADETTAEMPEPAETVEPAPVQDGPEDLIGEPDETTAEMPEPAETTEPAPVQDGPEDLIGEPDETTAEIPEPSSEEQGAGPDMVVGTTVEQIPGTTSEIPLNPLAGMEQLTSATSNMLQITFDGCLFQDNVVGSAVMGINDAVEVYLTNNVFRNNTIPPHMNHKAGTIIMLNDPLPSMYLESNCWIDNSYALSPVILEHGELAEEGFDALDLSENVNGNFVQDVIITTDGGVPIDPTEIIDDDFARNSSCPSHMLVVAPNQDDMFALNSHSLHDRLDRGAFSCVEMDIRDECSASIFTPDMLGSTSTSEAEGEGEGTMGAPAPAPGGDTKSKPIKISVIALTGSFLLLGVAFLCWSSGRNRKIRRDEYISRVLNDHAQP